MNTKRFDPTLEILTPAAEPTKTEKVSAAVASFGKRNSGILTFVAGLLTGSLLTIVSGLVR